MVYKHMFIQLQCCSIFLFCFIASSDQYRPCPKGCSQCTRTFLNCELFPKIIQSSINEVSIKNFQKSTLNKNDFNNWKNARIKNLTLRSNTFFTINSHAFSFISSVKFIDLSHNSLSPIKDYAFNNLNLDALLLDHCNPVVFSSKSFSGLRVAYLNLDNSRLRNLDFTVFSKLSTESLRELSLVSNSIKTINRRFYPIFLHLERLHLTDNPIVCNCSSLWMKKLVNNANKRKVKVNFPKCIAPSIVRDRLISDIDERELKCFRPIISALNFNLLSVNSMVLRCKIEVKNTTIDSGQVLVSLKNATGYLVQQQLNQAHIRLSRSEYQNSSNISCIAENEIGETSINISIKWPLVNMTTDKRVTTKINENQISNQKSNSFYFHKRYTLIELIIAIISTFTLTIIIFFFIYKVCILKSYNVIKYPTKSNWKYINSNIPNSNSNNLTIADTNYNNHNNNNNNNQYIQYRGGITNNDSKNMLPPLPVNNNPASPTPLSYMTNNTNNDTSSTNIHQHYPLMIQQFNADLQSLNIIPDSNSQTYDCISVNNNNNSSTLNSSNNALFTNNTVNNNPTNNNNILPAPIPPPPSNYINNNNNINCTLPRSKYNYSNNTYNSQPQFFDYKTQQRLYNGQI